MKSTAQTRAEAVALIENHAPERLRARLIESLRPAIDLKVNRCADEEIALGASKFGGAPDVPAAFEWPMWNEKPLGFLAQINLEAAAPFDIEGLLPKSGLLSFFYEVDEPNFTDVSTPGSWKVMFSSEPVRKLAEIERETEIGSASIDLSGLWMWPYHIAVENPQDQEPFWMFDYEFAPDNPCHRTLGYTTPIIGNPLEIAAERSSQISLEVPESPQKRQFFEREAENWILLLQLDSDEAINTMWGDAGTLYFVIHRDDLKARNFEKVWMELQFS